MELLNQESQKVNIPYCNASQTISGEKDQLNIFFQSIIDHFVKYKNSTPQNPQKKRKIWNCECKIKAKVLIILDVADKIVSKM